VFELKGALLALFLVEKLAADAHAEPEIGRGGVRFNIIITVDAPDEVDALAETVRRAGGRFTKPPTDAEFFVGRDAYFADPEGNYWEIACAPPDNRSWPPPAEQPESSNERETLNTPSARDPVSRPARHVLGHARVYPYTASRVPGHRCWEVARRLVDLAEGPPQGRVADCGGAEVVPIESLAAMRREVTGQCSRLVRVPRVGFLRDFDNGKHLCPDHRYGHISLEHWLRNRAAR
jgi:hypothetical protein